MDESQIKNEDREPPPGKGLYIAFVYNIRHVKPSLKNTEAMLLAEFDTPETIAGITSSLKKLGHKVFKIEADENAYLKLKKLKNRIDLVFNVAEGFYGADREAQIPAMLEMLQIPYVGSKPLTQSLCLNKAKTKEILLFHKIPTPPFQLFVTGKEPLNKNLRFPLIIKPNSEGSSKGIWQDSIVNNKAEFPLKLRKILKKLGQPVIVEELLLGREFTIGLIGNDPIEILPPVEIDFSTLPKKYSQIDSYEPKWVLDNPESDINTAICPAKIDKKLFNQIKDICLRAKSALDVLDWCRIDIRLNTKGAPYILEINQIPGIIPDPKENSRFPLAARTANYSYEQMLQKIITSSLERYKS